MKICNRIVCVFLSLYVIFGEATVAFARRAPKGAPELEAGVPWRAVLYTIIGLVCIGVVAFRTTKRTHMD